MQEQPGLKRTITTWPAILLVVSGIIGSGVFKKIAPMAESLQSPFFIMICWTIAGLISLAGALCNAELASMMPASGGEFRYFHRIYGKLFAFLYGWANLTVMKSATIAALAFIFSESFSVLVPLPQIHLFGSYISIKILASLLIITLSIVNYRGVVFSEKLSRVMIIGIFIVIALFVGSGIFSDKGAVSHFQPSALVPQGWQLFTAIFAASLGAFWGYEGWNNLGFIGEEVKNPQKNIPLALGVGTLIVILVYLSLNAVYVYVMPVEQLAAINGKANTIAAVEVANAISGNVGMVIISVLILFTTFNCTNTTVLTAARIFFAMSREGLFLKSAGKIHPVFQTPSTAIVLQGLWAIVLLWFSNFNDLTDLLIFASFIFYGSTALGVLLLRRREPAANRPYKVIGYPVLPAFFACFCLLLVVVTILRDTQKSMIGLGLIALGVPVYYYYLKKSKAAAA
ncbi:MAG TPA: amino acid permease [Chryseolinea sp.]|nr:amino acid permease [Chryseolinea sp.]